MKKNIFFNLFFFFILVSVFAEKIDVKYAQKIAKNIYFERISQIEEIDYSNINLSLVYTNVYNNEPIYYIFNVNKNDGFVIISADNSAKPIIAYSFNGIYDINNTPPSAAFFMETKANQLKFLKDNDLKASVEISKEWGDLENVTNKNLKDIKTIVPLLLSIWGQDGYYNDACPEDGGEQAIVGCVAVAMAQVMKFYDHPAVGQGSNSYSYPAGWPSYWPYGTLSANFGTTNYHWANIPYNCYSENDDIAELLYHCGVSVNMYYSPTGSGAQTSDVETALISNFRYNANHVYENAYSPSNWEILLKNEIDNNRPIVYSGSDASASSGHAWNCDGYQGSEFHMNWGWDGYADGYYALDDLNPSGSTFDSDFQAVIGIYPVSGYPEYCSGTKNIDGSSGSFNDGSGNEEYLNNIDCFYLIEPICGNKIDFSFDVFQLEANDVVTFYNGTSVSDPILATYTGNDTPGSVTADNGALLIEFNTNSSGTDIGWYGSYTTDYCGGIKTLITPTGTISDGSGPCDYESTYCRWEITPPGVGSITLNFTSFDLSSSDTYDYVKIYKESTITANEIITLTNASPPSGSIFVPSDIAWIKFATNIANHADGWSLNYTSSPVNVDELSKHLISLAIYPNPFSNDATLSLNLIDNSNISISVANVIGEVIGNYDITGIAGNNKILLSEIINNVDNGVYFITFDINGNKLVRKVICSK